MPKYECCKELHVILEVILEDMSRTSCPLLPICCHTPILVLQDLITKYLLCQKTLVTLEFILWNTAKVEPRCMVVWFVNQDVWSPNQLFHVDLYQQCLPSALYVFMESMKHGTNTTESDSVFANDNCLKVINIEVYAMLLLGPKDLQKVLCEI